MRYQGYQLTIGPALTPMVKYLVIASVIVFLLQQIGPGSEMTLLFGLSPYFVWKRLYIWQLGTYLFLHGNFWHIFWNMFALWMFGSDLERHWRSHEFLKFFFVTGCGAGLLSILFDPFSAVPTIGASGAIYGILMAYGMMFPNRLVYLYFLFPVKVKYFVAVLGALAFLSALSAPGSTIAHMAHLGGMLFAFLYLKGWLTTGGIRRSYHRWRMKRLRQRFKVYERDHRDDFWIH
ncbi:MAG: rhomboid family intramembrane serine protease [Acidobacteria bacterium]|nr:rhomboid family intramembrane serine protease [Acidobacteriota bacterium]